MTVVRGLFNVPEPLPDGGQRLLFRCPGCKFVHGPTIGPGAGPRWSFNGDYDRPVFGPSLLVKWRNVSTEGRAKNEAHHAAHGRWMNDAEIAPYWEDKVCHSFIGCNGAAPGQIVFLGDCTHELAGKVVDIPPFSWGDE